ncbi:hypothetical protein QJQ45_025020, partial [Haematococcus lacustris]
ICDGFTLLISMAKKRRTVPKPVPEDPDSDIEDRNKALQPDLTEAQRNSKASGEARAARDRDNTYHGRKCKLAHLTDHLWQRALGCLSGTERGVLASLGLGLLVRGLFTIRVADPLGLHNQPVYTDIPVSQAAIPDLSCRNLYLQLCRGPPGNGANTQPNAAVAAVLAAHPDLRVRLAAIPRHPSDGNMVDHIGKQLETAFSNMLTLLFAGRLKKAWINTCTATTTTAATTTATNTNTATTTANTNTATTTATTTTAATTTAMTTITTAATNNNNNDNNNTAITTTIIGCIRVASVAFKHSIGHSFKYVGYALRIVGMSLVSWVLHLDHHLGGLIERHGQATYAILFAIVFCETGLVLTPFLPGDSLLFAAGAFAGMGRLDLVTLVAVFLTSAILGDALNYWVGNKLGGWAVAKGLVKQEYVSKTQAYYEKYGGKTVVLARFVPIIRTFAPFVAGVGSMPYTRFAWYNVLGAVIWTVLFVGGGFFFGNLPFVQASVKKNFTLVVLAIVAISVVPVALELMAARRDQAGRGPEPSTGS